MLPSQKEIEKVLFKQLAKLVPADQLRAIASELVELGSEWEEVKDTHKVVGASISVQCEDICMVGEAMKNAVPVRIFKKRS